MTHSHYFTSVSDADNFAESHANAELSSNGHTVVIDCVDEAEKEYWEGCEEWGPFPGDHSDLR